MYNIEKRKKEFLLMLDRGHWEFHFDQQRFYFYVNDKILFYLSCRLITTNSIFEASCTISAMAVKNSLDSTELTAMYGITINNYFGIKVIHLWNDIFVTRTPIKTKSLHERQNDYE